MKIVNKTEFYALPEGTLYSDYEPCIFTSLKVKGSTLYSEEKPTDFIYESLIGNIDAESSSHFVDMLDDAEIGIVVLNSTAGTAKETIDIFY